MPIFFQIIIKKYYDFILFNFAHQSIARSLLKSAIIAYSYRIHSLLYQKNFIVEKRREILDDFAEKLN